MTWGTLLVLPVLCLGVGGIILSLLKNRKQGKGSCGCGCSSCAMRGSCHKAD